MKKKTLIMVNFLVGKEQFLINEATELFHA